MYKQLLLKLDLKISIALCIISTQLFISSSNSQSIIIPKCCKPFETVQIRQKQEFQFDSSPIEIDCFKNSTQNETLVVEWSPTIYSNPNTVSVNDSILIEYRIGIPRCQQFGYLDSEKFRILENGVTIISSDSTHNYDPGEHELNHEHDHVPKFWFKIEKNVYCIDQLILEDDEAIRQSSEEFETVDVILFCAETYNQELQNMNEKLGSFIFEIFESAATTTGIISIISSIFLGLALLIYLICWRIHNIHGWTKFSFLLAAFLTYFIAGLRRLIGFEILVQWKLAPFFEALEDCGAVSTSANLVALSFDLFFTFWKSQTSINESDGRIRFAIMTTLAWLTGIIVMIVGLIIKTQSRFTFEMSEFSNLSLHISKLLEFFLCIQNDMLFSVCFPIVQLGLFSINMMLFLLSIFVLYQRYQESKLAYENIVKKQIIKIWTSRYAKLFIIMGLWWPIIMICVYECINMKNYTLSSWNHLLNNYYLDSSSDNDKNSSLGGVGFKIPWHLYLIANILAINAIMLSFLFGFTNEKIRNELKKKYQKMLRWWRSHFCWRLSSS